MGFNFKQIEQVVTEFIKKVINLKIRRANSHSIKKTLIKSTVDDRAAAVTRAYEDDTRAGGIKVAHKNLSDFITEMFLSLSSNYKHQF